MNSVNLKMVCSFVSRKSTYIVSKVSLHKTAVYKVGSRRLFSSNSVIGLDIIEKGKKTRLKEGPSLQDFIQLSNLNKDITSDYEHLVDLPYTNSLDFHVKSRKGDDGTMDFLAKLIDTYWEGSTMSVCHKSQCKKPEGPWVLCETCDHWFHMECVNLSKLPRKYLCNECRT